jgi:hypothetical protein
MLDNSQRPLIEYIELFSKVSSRRFLNKIPLKVSMSFTLAPQTDSSLASLSSKGGTHKCGCKGYDQRYLFPFAPPKIPSLSDRNIALWMLSVHLHQC